MKENGVPEKLYLLPNGLISYCRNTDEDVEYTRTDASIEKAFEWISKNIRPYYSDVKYKYEDFKRYMEG